jgi:zinc transporter 5/7
VLSGFFNSLFLIFVAFSVLTESIERFYVPQKINSDGLLLVSVLGFLVNLVGLFFFHDLTHDHGDGGCDHGHSKTPKHEEVEEEHKHDHDHENSHGHDHHKHEKHDHKHEAKHEHHHHDENMTGVFLHILADALGSVGVIISSLLIKYYDCYVADPICSFIISLFIFMSAIPLF